MHRHVSFVLWLHLAEAGQKCLRLMVQFRHQIAYLGLNLSHFTNPIGLLHFELAKGSETLDSRLEKVSSRLPI